MIRKLAQTIYLLAIFVGTVSGCSPPEVAQESVATDPWLLAPPTSNLSPEPIPANSYFPVTTDRIAEAEEFLEEIGTSQISPSEVAYFVGHDVELPNATRPFLVRALSRSAPGHTLSVLGNALWARSHDDPKDVSPLRRQPLVLIMQEVPELVYVTIGE